MRLQRTLQPLSRTVQPKGCETRRQREQPRLQRALVYVQHRPKKFHCRAGEREITDPPLGGGEKGSGALRASASPRRPARALGALLGRGQSPQTPRGGKPPPVAAERPPRLPPPLADQEGGGARTRSRILEFFNQGGGSGGGGQPVLSTRRAAKRQAKPVGNGKGCPRPERWGRGSAPMDPVGGLSRHMLRIE
jgi:hypothetical protein